MLHRSPASELLYSHSHSSSGAFETEETEEASTLRAPRVFRQVRVAEIYNIRRESRENVSREIRVERKREKHSGVERKVFPREIESGARRG